jgi:NhaP-type Na+/H+ or K+/H+ antiporter
MEIALAILAAGFLIFLAHLFSALFDKVRIPDVLILVLIGLLIGPVTGLVSPEALGKVGYVFAMVTLIIILFESGLGLSFSALRESMGRGTRLTVINFVASLAVVVPLSVLVLEMSVLEGFVLGAILGGTSSAVVIPIVSKLRLQQGSRTALVLESAFSDVLCIVFALGFIHAFEYHAVRPTVILGTAIASVLLAAVIGAIAAFFWASVLNRVRQLRGSIFLTPAFVFIVFGVTELLGFSGAISALAFGIVLGNIHSLERWKLLRLFRFKDMALFRSIKSVNLSEMEKAFLGEIVFLLKAFFFVYVGLSIHLSDLTLVLTALGLTLGLFLMRIPVVHLAMDKAITRFDASVAAVMVPKGLAAAVLATLPLQAGMENGAVIQEVTYAVILFSIIAATVLTFLIEKSRLRQLYASLFSRYASETDVDQRN